LYVKFDNLPVLDGRKTTAKEETNCKREFKSGLITEEA
jgi:hypothetical protein